MLPLFLSHFLFSLAGYFVGSTFRIYPEATPLLPPRLKPPSPVTWITAGASSLSSLLLLLATTLPLPLPAPTVCSPHSSQRDALKKQVQLLFQVAPLLKTCQWLLISLRVKSQVPPMIPKARMTWPCCVSVSHLLLSTLALLQWQWPPSVPPP